MLWNDTELLLGGISAIVFSKQKAYPMKFYEGEEKLRTQSFSLLFRYTFQGLPSIN
jgi:hypothetical protein